MKNNFFRLSLITLSTVFTLSSCKDEVVGPVYEPIGLNNIRFDTIPTNTLPFKPLADLGELGVYNPQKVSEAKPKWKYIDENGKEQTGEPNDYAPTEVKEAYKQYLINLNNYNTSLNLLKDRDKGAIRITWEQNLPTSPQDSNLYVEVTYFDFKKNKEMKRNATSVRDGNVYRGYVIIPGTLRTYTHDENGVLRTNPNYYKFNIQPLSGSLKRGEVYHIDNAYSSLFKRYQYLDNKEEISLNEKTIWLLDKNKKISKLNGDGDSGAFKNLYDGNGETYFHTRWEDDAGKDAFPYSFGIDAGGLRGSFTFEYDTRHNQANGCPTEISVYASTESTFANANEVKLGTLDKDSKLPQSQKTTYESPLYILTPIEYRYFRVQIDKSSGDKFFSLAEFRVYSASTKIMDPETNEADRW